MDRVQKLAGLIADGLEVGNWGDIDPVLFKIIATDEDPGDLVLHADATSLGVLLAVALAKLDLP